MPRLRPFEKSLMKALGIHLLPKLSGNPQALSDVLVNDLAGGDGPRRITSEYNALEFDLWRIQRAHREVEKSIQTLSDIAVYLSKCPFAEDEIPPSRYLQFHAEAFVSETYILRERMEVLLKISKRQLKKLRPPAATAAQVDGLLAHVHAALEPVVDVRRKHTHEERLNEAAIERLDTIDLLLTFPEAGVQRIAKKVRPRAIREAFIELRRRVSLQTRIAKALRRECESVLLKALFFRGSPYLLRVEA